MKITRLQQESDSSCECGGKNSTKEKSFVSKNKIYETRSGIQRRQESDFSDCSNRFSLKKLNLRSKVYEMEAPIISLPLNGNNKLMIPNEQKLSSSPRRKLCDLSKRKKVVINGTLNGKSQNLTQKTIERKLSSNFCEMNDGNSTFQTNEDNAVVNLKRKFSVETSDYKIPNGNINNLTNGCDCFDAPVKQEPLENGNHVSNVSKKLQPSDDEPSNCDNGILTSNISLSNEEKQKQRRNRKTNFELFIRETCESLKIGAVNCKRERKIPTSYAAMLSPKKEKECFDSNLKSNLTLAGVPKKKTGRKPKPKGPIHHYLDLHVKEKGMMTTVNDSAFLEMSNFHDDNKIDAVSSKTANIENENSVNSISEQSHSVNVENIKVEKNSPSPISTDLHFRYRTFSADNSAVKVIYPKKESSKVSKRKRKGRKFPKQKKQKVEKIEACDYNSSVTHVLGYRTNKAVREVLVHFEDGTSNWIPYIERETDKCNLQMFFEHEDQDLSVINRLGYQVVCGATDTDTDVDNDSSTITAVSDSSYFEDDFDNDSDDVFFTTLPYRCTDQVPQGSCLVSTQISSKLGSNRMFSDENLNDILDYVISSHNVKLYPHESLQEVVFKSQEEFVHIYLKRMLTKCDAKSIDTLNLKSCEKLISILEECAFNNQCKVVVISGIEEYFALNDIFEKLLRKSAALERTKYEQDVSVIRYLIQTIRNFNKPIVGVIKKTANGLSASLLSLFDMVFHERTGAVSKMKQNNDDTNRKRKVGKQHTPIKEAVVRNENCTLETETCQTFLFPRLLGLSEINEAKIMGEHQIPHSMESCNLSYFNSSLSQQLKGSLRHMKNNCKIQIKSRSSRAHSTRTRMSLELNDHDIITSPLSAVSGRHCESREELMQLEKQIRQEKELAETYMAELQATLDSLTTRDCR